MSNHLRSLLLFVVAASAACGRNTDEVCSYTDFGQAELVTLQGFDGGSSEDPALTSDGRYLLFDGHADAAPDSGTTGTSTVSYAQMLDYKTFDFVGPVQGIQEGDPSGQAAPAIDSSGNLYFLTGRSYAQNYDSIWHGSFSDGTVTNLAAVDGISLQRSGWFNMGASPTRDGQLLFFTDNGNAVSTISVASRNADGSFTRLPDADTLLSTINDTTLSPFGVVYGPGPSADGTELFFTAPPRLFVARRRSTTEPFGPPQAIAGTLTPPQVLVEGAAVSLDGKHLYFHVVEAAGGRIMVMSRDVVCAKQ